MLPPASPPIAMSTATEHFAAMSVELTDWAQRLPRSELRRCEAVSLQLDYSSVHPDVLY
jgi:hypothetical protein